MFFQKLKISKNILFNTKEKNILEINIKISDSIIF